MLSNTGLLSIPVTCLILFTVGGNLLIIVAVCKVRKLREPSNILYVSMALADLMVGIIVVPLACFYEIRREWTLGPILCNFWTYSDVLLCTSSILHLCIISIDRYLVIKRPLLYSPKRTIKRMILYAALAWLLSVSVSAPMPIRFHAIVAHGQCRVNPHLGYQIYATMAAFYIPVIVMFFINVRIYITVRDIRRKDESLLRSSVMNHSAGNETVEEAMPLSDASVVTPNLLAGAFLALPAKEQENSEKSGKSTLKRAIRCSVKYSFRRLNSKAHALHGNTKAVKTLLIITVAFVGCWLPFFVTTLIDSICDSCSIPTELRSVCLWLGFANSAINPFLIVLFNKDFKTTLLDQNPFLQRCKRRVESAHSGQSEEPFSLRTLTPA